MDKQQLQEYKNKFSVGQELSIILALDGTDVSATRKKRRCRIIQKYEDHLLVEYIDHLGKYNEGFKYTDFISKYVQVTSWK